MGLSQKINEYNREQESGIPEVVSGLPYPVKEEPLVGLTKTKGVPTLKVKKSKTIKTLKKVPKKRVKKNIKDIKGGVESGESIKAYLLSKKYHPSKVEEFMNWKGKTAGWNGNLKKAENLFKQWHRENYPKIPLKTPVSTPVASPAPAKEEEKAPPPSPHAASPAAPPPPAGPAPPPAPAPVAPAAPAAPVKGAFKLNEKEFGIIKSSSPRYEWKILLKNFFNEMSLTSYGRIPAQFIKDVNALNLKGSESSTKIDKLQAIIDAYKPSVAPEATPEAKTKKIVKPSIVMKKPRKSKVAIKKSKTKTLPKKEKIKKKKLKSKALKLRRRKGPREPILLI